MKIIAGATQIVKTLTARGYTAYFAGGWVRDWLMGHPSNDIDIATDAPPEKILELFDKTIPVGIAFGVVIVVIDGHQFEVSTFRRDIESHGRRPEKVEHSTPEEDAARRDFTINGLFYDPLTSEVHDYVGGKEDIQTGIIRTIGNPRERFYEDRLRMIRAVRFATRFGFHMDAETEKAIQEHAHTLFPHVAMERVWQEFCKMALFPEALLELHRLKLLPVIFKSLKDVPLEELEKRVAAISFFPDNCPPILKLMELFPEATLKERLALCEYLKVGTINQRLVEFISTSQEMIKQPQTLSFWTHFYANPKAKLCLDIAAAHLTGEAHTHFLEEHATRMEKLLPHSTRVAEKKPLITGKMLQEHGIQAGQLLGTLLKEAEYLAITHDLHEAAPVLALLQKSPNWPHP